MKGCDTTAGSSPYICHDSRSNEKLESLFPSHSMKPTARKINVGMLMNLVLSLQWANGDINSSRKSVIYYNRYYWRVHKRLDIKLPKKRLANTYVKPCKELAR